MKTLKTALDYILLPVGVYLLLAIAGGANLSADSSNDRLDNDSSRTFSPGYINAARGHAKSAKIIYVERSKTNSSDAVSKADDKIRLNIAQGSEKSGNRPAPILQKKFVRGGKSTRATSSSAAEITKSKAEILTALESAINANQTFFGNRSLTDKNLDMNNDGIVNATDTIMLRNMVNSNNPANFSLVFDKITAAFADRYGVAKGSAKYISYFDMDGSGVIDKTDYSGAWNTLTEGKASIPTYAMELKPVMDTTGHTAFTAPLIQNNRLDSGFPYNDSGAADYLSYNPNTYKKPIVSTLKAFFNSKDDGEQADGVNSKPLDESPALQAGKASHGDAEEYLKLADIFKNPTENQKAILDALRAFFVDTEKAEKGSDNQTNPELNKARNELLQAVANVLLAQGPDVLNKGDISDIRAIFSDLDNAKGKILLEYAKSTKPYYNSIIKDLARNMAVLQSNNILNPGLSKEDLVKLPPSELDKILEKIKRAEKRAFEEEYLLQQEDKYRKAYLEPGRERLQEDMKDMMNSFSKRLNDTLKI